MRPGDSWKRLNPQKPDVYSSCPEPLFQLCRLLDSCRCLTRGLHDSAEFSPIPKGQRRAGSSEGTAEGD